MLSAKYFDDKYYNNKYFALIGGIKLKELNLLEQVFLNSLDFWLFVEEPVYN